MSWAVTYIFDNKSILIWSAYDELIRDEKGKENGLSLASTLETLCFFLPL